MRGFTQPLTGEHADLIIRGLIARGSSPRARGTHLAINECAGIQRFIPAGAGNTTSEAQTCTAPTVHPRGRGEHGRIYFTGGYRAGSSPRARGTRPARHPARLSHRFIPAGAGNTYRYRSRVSCVSVHPRGRGEHILRMSAAPPQAGSSPRARGTRLRFRFG